MQKNILITGLPKSGKSTLLRKLISSIPHKAGFVTDEILAESGRVGFEIVTHTNRQATLAHIDFATKFKVSKYFVDIENLQSVIPEVQSFSNDDLLYIDEIGQMQLFSEEFKKLALAYLNSPNTFLATISYVFEDDFTRMVKERDDVILVEITAENREDQERFISQLLKKIGKAKKYISEPDRFTVGNNSVVLKSDHSTRNLILAGGRWQCDCDFWKQYGICSHAIAVKEIVT